jgi:transcriptional regulator with XRE-family HTH domain
MGPGRPSKPIEDYAESAGSLAMGVIAQMAARRGLTQTDLARARGVSRSTIQRNFETRNPWPKVILDYCEVLGLGAVVSRALANTMRPEDYGVAAQLLRIHAPTDFERLETLSEKKRRTRLREVMIRSIVRDISKRERFAEAALGLLLSLEDYGMRRKEALSLASDVLRLGKKRGLIRDLENALKGLDDAPILLEEKRLRP